MKVFIMVLVALYSSFGLSVECDDNAVCYSERLTQFTNPVDIRPNIIMLLDREDSISLKRKLESSDNLVVLKLLTCFSVTGKPLWLKEAEVQFNNGLEYEDTPLKLNKIMNHRTFKKLVNLYRARGSFKCLCGELNEKGSTPVLRNVLAGRH